MLQQLRATDFSPSPGLTTVPRAPRRGAIIQGRVRPAPRGHCGGVFCRAGKACSLSRAPAVAVYDSLRSRTESLSSLRVEAATLVAGFFSDDLKALLEIVSAERQERRLRQAGYLSIRRRFSPRSKGKPSVRPSQPRSRRQAAG